MGKNSRDRKSNKNRSAAATRTTAARELRMQHWIGLATRTLTHISMELTNGKECRWTITGEKGSVLAVHIIMESDGPNVQAQLLSEERLNDEELNAYMEAITDSVFRALFNLDEIDWRKVVAVVAARLEVFFRFVKDTPTGLVSTEGLVSWDCLQHSYADARVLDSSGFKAVARFSRGFTLLCGARIDIQFDDEILVRYPATCDVSDEIVVAVNSWAEAYGRFLALRENMGDAFTNSSYELRCMLQVSLAQTMISQTFPEHTAESCGSHAFSLPAWLTNSKNSESVA